MTPGDFEDSFSEVLLTAFVSPPDEPTAARLLGDVLIRFGGALGVTILTAVSTSILRETTIRPTADGKSTSESRTVRDSFSSLLFPGSFRTRTDSAAATAYSRNLTWPEIPAAVTVEYETPEDEERRSSSRIRETIESFGRNLLCRASRPGVIIPNPLHLEAMAEFCAGAGHEINNPLGSIIGQTQLLLRRESPADVRQSLEIIGSQAWRIRDMIGDTMLFARPPSPEIQSANLVTLTKSTLAGVAANHARPEVQIDLDCFEPAIEIECDSAQIQTMIGRLIHNSIEAILNSELPGRVIVSLRSEPRHGAVVLSVCDDGPGITDAVVRRHLFDPFFSGRSAGRGLGFGLSLAWQIVRSHHGMLLFEPTGEGGAGFHIALPTRQPDQPSIPVRSLS